MRSKERSCDYDFALDTRDGVGYVSSRIGMKRPAIAIDETTDIFGFIEIYLKNLTVYLSMKPSFLKRHHVYDLARVVDELDIPCYGIWFKK